MPRTTEEPPSPIARAAPARAPRITCVGVGLADPGARATLQAWLEVAPALARRTGSRQTRTRLADARRIGRELARVLDGLEPGEGRAADRTLHLAVALGRVHAVSSMFACPGGTFVELLVTAPWNLLGAADPPDARTVRGAGKALVAAAAAWSRARGCGGAVALQAGNPRCAEIYDHLGFRELRPEDDPLALVPQGARGWSPEILRVAAGRPGPAERRRPWLVLPGARADALAAPLRAAG
ncbi:MAG TPA: N-acetyltransferase [Anaeromyxobacteraceae bacterium]|nr:N-acetyltransferase [Anaeromyxobacteraceae bacterium]